MHGPQHVSEAPARSRGLVLPELLGRGARAHPDRPALVYRRHRAHPCRAARARGAAGRRRWSPAASATATASRCCSTTDSSSSSRCSRATASAPCAVPINFRLDGRRDRLHPRRLRRRRPHRRRPAGRDSRDRRVELTVGADVRGGDRRARSRRRRPTSTSTTRRCSVHVRHDRAAEGRDAHAPEPVAATLNWIHEMRRRRGRRLALGPAAVPHRRRRRDPAVPVARRPGGHRPDDGVRRRRRHRADRCATRVTHVLLRPDAVGRRLRHPEVAGAGPRAPARRHVGRLAGAARRRSS